MSSDAAGATKGGKETIRDIAHIIFYLSLSVSGPLAMYEHLKARRTDTFDMDFQSFMDHKI